jgi:PhnB protein
MPHPIPYLGFNGNCAEAMRFYERALEARIEIMMKGGDSPAAAQVPKEFADRILHARLVFKDGGVLYAGDAPAHIPYEGVKGVSITLNYDTTVEAQKVFNALAEGGRITMPLQPTFWAKIWGMLIDKFGTPWIVNGDLVPL